MRETCGKIDSLNNRTIGHVAATNARSGALSAGSDRDSMRIMSRQLLSIA